MKEDYPMPNAFQGVFVVILFPVAAIVVGGIVAAFRPPGPQLQSYLQHFAAGVVFAAAAGEVLPEIMHERSALALIVGFALGVAAMLGIKQLTEKLEQRGVGTTEQPTRLIIVVGIDLLIDGLLVGVGFAAGAKVGLLLTVALTLEILFLGLSTAAELAETGATRRRVVMITAALDLLVAVGALVGVTLLNGLSGFALATVLSFGAAALLYLVTEELLVEAHEIPDTPMITAAFFVGFLVLFAIEMIA
jgi:ZIP family zinc transporter